MERLLTIKDLCANLGVSQSLIYKWVHYDFVPHIKIGSLVRFRESDINKWIANKARKGRERLRIEI